jgi:hypothetical protein
LRVLGEYYTPFMALPIALPPGSNEELAATDCADA